MNKRGDLLYWQLLVILSACCAYYGHALSPGRSPRTSSQSRQHPSLTFGHEKRLVEEQLGYVPTNFVRVSAWKQNGNHPVAIQTYPLKGGSQRRQARTKVSIGKNCRSSHAPAFSGSLMTAIGTPFPTLFWLSCPQIGQAVADLERTGVLQEVETELRASAKMRKDLYQCHLEYAQCRWSSLTEEHRRIFDESTLDDPILASMRKMLLQSGISGSKMTFQTGNTNPFDLEFVQPPAVKCLHAHYAHFRSSKDVLDMTENPVGWMVDQMLQERFPTLEL